MIHELREYEIPSENWDEYWTFFSEVAAPIRRSDFGRLIGLWRVKNSLPLRFLHVWEFESLYERAHKRAELAKIDAWRNDFLPHAARLVSSQQVNILKPLQVKPLLEVQAETLFLQRFQCRLGQAPAFAAALLEQRGADIQALWCTEMPDPNEVVVLSTAPVLFGTADSAGPQFADSVQKVRAARIQELELIPEFVPANTL